MRKPRLSHRFIACCLGKNMCPCTTTAGITSGHHVTPLSPTSARRNPALSSRQQVCVIISTGSHAVNDWPAWTLLIQHQFLLWLEGPRCNHSRDGGGRQMEEDDSRQRDVCVCICNFRSAAILQNSLAHTLKPGWLKGGEMRQADSEHQAP